MIDYRMKNRNTTWQLTMHKSEFFTNQLLLNLGVIFLFTLSSIPCFLLNISLWRQSRQMQLKATGFRNSCTEACMKAIQVLISFITLFTSRFIGIAIEIPCFTVPDRKLLFIFVVTTTAVYPWDHHSFILILGSSTLQQASLMILQQFKCCDKGMPLRAAQTCVCQNRCFLGII